MGTRLLRVGRTLARKGRRLVRFNPATGAGAECCCTGGNLVRARDCCSTVFAWFSVSAIGCDPSVGKVVKWDAKCWVISDLVLSPSEVAAQYPTETVYEVVGPPLVCLDSCEASGCPNCDDCCWITEPDHLRCPNDCYENNLRCTCGQEWVVTWNLHKLEYNRGCEFPTGVSGCTTVETHASGSITWRYTDIDGVCSLYMYALNATRSQTLTYGPACTGNNASYNDSNDLQNPGNFFTFRGCGQSPLLLATSLLSGLPYGFASICSGCRSDGACYPCNCTDDEPCPGGTVGSFFHAERTGSNTCTSKSLHQRYFSICDLSCSQPASECVLDFDATVTVTAGCDGTLPPGGGVTPGGFF